MAEGELDWFHYMLIVICIIQSWIIRRWAEK